MAFFEWDKSLDVGVAEMNQQHQALISLMETLYQQNLAGIPKAELLTTASELVNFVVKHFKDEEEYMRSKNFFGLEAHKKLHEHLLTDLANFVNDFSKGSNTKIGGEFITFLKFWLFTHIRGIDTKYGPTD
jgi:hemerythrin-like metal-binding protein